MTATPIEGQAPVVWFLTAHDDSSSIRITPGLTLREDAAGRLRFTMKPDQQGWIRFDLDDGAPWVTVVSPQHTLMSGKRTLGNRMRLDESLTLALPHVTFQISRSFADRRRAHRTEVRLVRTDHADSTEAPSLRLLPQTRPDIDVAPVKEPAPRPERPAAVPAASLDVADRVDFSAPLPAYARAEPAVRPRPLDAPVVAPRRDRRRPRPERRSHRLLGWTAGLLALLWAANVGIPLALPAMDALAPAGSAPEAATPNAVITETGYDESFVDPAEPTVEPTAAAPGSLLTSVEELLSQRPQQDAATLRFAIEAYQAASLDHPRDRALRERLADLQRALADVAAP
jgi:hypothetical protein